MLSHAILIDGGFVRKKLGNRASPLSAGTVESLIYWMGTTEPLQGSRLYRVYFYDARPLDSVEQRPLGGSPEDFSQSDLAKNNRELHAGLTRVKYLSIRMGELAFGGWGLARRILQSRGTSVTVTASDLRPEVRQKGVDMRIGLDIAALTLKKHAQVIALVTGDSDFVPAMKFARREGAQLALFTLGHGVYPAMHEHADVVVDASPPDHRQAAGAAAVMGPSAPVSKSSK